MKRILPKVLLITVTLITLLKPVYAQEKAVSIHLFWSKTCPHCAKEKEFLEKWAKEDTLVKVETYEVTEYKNALLLLKIGKKLDIDASGIPFTVIGDQYLVGYDNTDSYNNVLKEMVEKTKDENLPDIVVEIDAPNRIENQSITEDPTIPNVIKLPILGNINIKRVSLPTLTFVLAFADGFNPCAMWVLLFLISLLLGMDNRKKMWLLGGTFILASGVVYFLFLTAWLNLFLFLGYISWIRLVVGGVALVAGYHYLRNYIKNKDGGCEVIGSNAKRKKIFEKLRRFVTGENLVISLVGIALLAFGVNVVEFVCSAGLPAIFTKILTLSLLPTWQYYTYLLFYVVVFMLDDLVVFGIAMVTLNAFGIESKYARYSHLVGGVLMVGIGLLMIFKPDLLMFG